MSQQIYEQLLSDEVFMAGVSASDAGSLWRSLARTDRVREVARSLASDRARILQLCRFVEDLLKVRYDKQFRHPHDIAIAGALVILEQSPLSEVRNLFSRLRAAREPSLALLQRMADYCGQRFADAQHQQIAFPVPQGGVAPRALARKETANIQWADASLERRRYSLQVT